MTDNDIDALLRFVNGEPIVGTDDETEEIFKGFARALTALVAERYALRAELAAAKAHAGDLSDEVKILRIYGNKDCTSMADAALAAMRKGDSGGK